MASQKSKFVRSLVFIVILIGGLWAGGAYGHSQEKKDARAECTARTKPTTTPTPTPTPSASASPTVVASPSPSVSASSPKAAGVRGLLDDAVLVATASPTVSPTASGSPSAAAKKSPICDDPTLIRLGLDLQGGISVVLAPKDETAKVDRGSLEKARDIIAQRVDALGVAEPDITAQGNNILIQLPGIKDQKKALDLIGTIAKLSFRPMIGPITDPKQIPPDTRVPNCEDPSTYAKDDPAKNVIMCAKQRDDNGQETPRGQWGLFQLGPVALAGDDVSGADAALPTGSPAWEVDLRLTSTGAKKFTDITGKLACNQQGDPKREMAIVLDSVIETHPGMGETVQCNTGIAGGTAQITGAFSEKEAKDLALVLKYGALPIELKPITTTTVSPLLGRDSLRGGLYAGAIGLAAVFIYVLLFYRALGMIVWIGISIHAVLTIGVVILLGQTAGFALSLAGIAGLIVSLGIATDSFIVYFERIKDEVHQGKSVRASVDRAWTSAWRTILAADLVTALAAIVLYFLAVGGVRGFALTLGLATALDLFVSRLFMHPSVWLLAQGRMLGESKTLGMGAVAGGMMAEAPGGSR
jgi:preprotein translocase subunit SecD